MPKSTYSLIAKATDATAFTQTRFGKHYLKRLTKKLDAALEIVMDKTYSNSYRANAGTEASMLKKELEYFQLMKDTLSDPATMAKLRAKAEEAKAKKTV
jgi:hypothetical protein